jgi:3-hydroxyacyl-[acyl-carrier-protein] dehydratase
MLYNSDQIQQIIPHRYPFLFVDQILSIEDQKIVGIKAVSANEMHFLGHFPQKHVMPGVLIMEALAQTGAVLLLSQEQFKGKLAYFAGMDKVRFKRQVVPGDVLRLEVELVQQRGAIGFASAKAYVGDQLAASGELMFAVDLT